MPRRAIVTIVDCEHLAEATVAIQSALKFYECDAYAFVATKRKIPEVSDITWLNFNDVLGDELTELIYYKYSGDNLRWALKPCVLQHLLKTHEQVIYFDCDCYFVDQWSFIWDEIDPILITPHWRNPTNKFTYLHGLYNAGFVGVSKGSEEAMEWWKELCFWKTERNLEEGLFVDQRYLDLMPIEWGANICKHRGINAAPWNENRENLVMVHLSARFQIDEALKPYLAEYDYKVSEAREWVPQLKEHKVYMIARQEADKSIRGPVGGKVYSFEQAQIALEFYQTGQMGQNGEFVIAPLSYRNE